MNKRFRKILVFLGFLLCLQPCQAAEGVKNPEILSLDDYVTLKEDFDPLFLKYRSVFLETMKSSYKKFRTSLESFEKVFLKRMDLHPVIKKKS